MPKPRVLALLLASLAVGQALWAAAREGWTYDEPIHLQWSERFLDTGVTERTSQERFNSKSPIMVPGVLAREGARRAGAADPSVLRFAARLPSVLWLVGLLALVYAAGREIGERTALLATAAAALDPNLVAHASLATADLPFACATAGSLLYAYRLWRRPSLAPAVLLGLFVGTAFVAKVSAVLLLPGLAALPFLARGERGQGDGDGSRRRWAALV